MYLLCKYKNRIENPFKIPTLLLSCNQEIWKYKWSENIQNIFVILNFLIHKIKGWDF